MIMTPHAMRYQALRSDSDCRHRIIVLQPQYGGNASAQMGAGRRRLRRRPFRHVVENLSISSFGMRTASCVEASGPVVLPT
jgi:hypothetical protein